MSEKIECEQPCEKCVICSICKKLACWVVSKEEEKKVCERAYYNHPEGIRCEDCNH